MTAVILNGNESVNSASVLGEQFVDNGKETKFIKHVALLCPEEGKPIKVKKNDSPKVYHIRDVGFLHDDTITAYGLAWLDEDEKSAEKTLKELLTIIADVQTRYRISWTAHPAHPPISEPPTIHKKDAITHKTYDLEFSCVGFVLWCFEKILKSRGKSLLVNSSALPKLQKHKLWDLLKKAYNLDNVDPKKLQEWGLDPWPEQLVLPGYVIHALESSSLPYTPAESDAYFK